MEEFRYIKGVSTLRLNSDGCIGCGQCETVCPHRVFVLKKRKATIIDKDGCMECGACANNCPVKVISVSPGVGCASYIIQRWLKKVRPGIKTACC